MELFNNIKALIIDMDGVLWHGSQPMLGLTEFFATIRGKKIPFILATNNASLTPDQYVAKIAKMGVEIYPGEILTSAIATAHYLSQSYDPSSTRVFLIGEDGARTPLLERGFSMTGIYELNASAQNDTQRGADIVVCGLDRGISWDKIATATLNIREGAKFIGTNADTTLPTEYGLSHGNGAILAALEAATGVKPTIIGKPEPIMYRHAISLLGVTPEETVAIGDKLETDILGAVRSNMRSILVLSGVSQEEDIDKFDFKPTWVLPDIRAVTKALSEL